MWPMNSSIRSSTGIRNFSARLKALTVWVKHSSIDDGQRAMVGWSPWVPHRACIMSAWAPLVGSPVEGPPRWTLTMTQGSSAMQPYPSSSIISENPGPEVAVMALAPAAAAPRTEAIPAISSSIWMNFPPYLGSMAASSSATSVEGVMG
jgi:hypothetical protein